MRTDIRKHAGLRDQVAAGLAVLRSQGRQIWGPSRHTLDEIVVRLMVGVGDLARAARDGNPLDPAAWRTEVKKELGNVILSTVRWIDDLGLDATECIELAVAAQEQFAKSGRPR